MGNNIYHENIGKWKLDREIGRGAYGVVYLGKGPNDEQVAVKVCSRTEVDDKHFAREFRGARLYQAVPASRGLVRQLELGEFADGFYQVMELADDEFDNAVDQYRPKTLASLIAGEKALPINDCLHLGLALAEGLATLQRHHLLHRDIKPGNVIYVNGEPVLSDPGLLVNEAEAASLVGTPGYVPPENFTSSGGDVYSLGLTLKAASFGRAVEELALGPTLDADTGSPIFPAWWRVLNKATHPDPAKRYRSAKALLHDLRLLQAKKRFMVFTKRLPMFLLLFVFVVVVLLSAFAIKEKMSFENYKDRMRRETLEKVKSAFQNTKRDLDQIHQNTEKVRRAIGHIDYGIGSKASRRQRAKANQNRKNLKESSPTNAIPQLP